MPNIHLSRWCILDSCLFTLECNEKLFILHTLTFIYFTDKISPKRKEKIKKLKKKNWVWNTALHTCITKGPGGRTCTQLSQAWPGLATKLFASQWLIMWRAEQHSEMMCARFALVPSPLSYQFLSSHSLLLFIALQLICLVLKGAEQTWVSWVDMWKIYTWAWLWTSEQKTRSSAVRAPFCFAAELSWAELIWADLSWCFCCACAKAFCLSTNLNFFIIKQHKNSSLNQTKQLSSRQQ